MREYRKRHRFDTCDYIWNLNRRGHTSIKQNQIDRTIKDIRKLLANRSKIKITIEEQNPHMKNNINIDMDIWNRTL